MSGSKQFGPAKEFPKLTPASGKTFVSHDPTVPKRFVDLADTFSDYAGKTGKMLIVNNTADGITTLTIPTILTTQQVTDIATILANKTALINITTSGSDNVPTGLAVSSTGVGIGSGGSQTAYVVLTWTPIVSGTFDHYKIRYKKDGYTYYTYVDVTTNTVVVDGLTPNTLYDFGIASINKYGTSSAFSTDITETTAADDVAPADVIATSATAGIQYIIVEWEDNTDLDLESYNVYRSTSGDSSTAVLIANTKANYLIDGNRTGGQIYYYWIKAVDTSGNESVDFSDSVSATPRNVTSDDIVAIAGSKVLIDGVVYLSDWRNSSDLTKIDGGKIYAGSVTTSQLNFVPVTGSNVIAKINASAEGITIDADNITINGATTFGSGYDPTGRVLAVGGSYDSAASGARVRIFPDANTGIQVIDDAAADVFKVEVGGTNVGDVTIGNWAGGQGIKYDKSAGTTSFAGTLVASAGTIGSFNIGTYLNTGSKEDFGDNVAGIHMGDDGFSVAYGGETLFYVAPTGHVKATKIDQLTFNPDGSGYGMTIISGSIFDANYAGDGAVININLIGYNFGSAYYRNTVIGDGRNHPMITVYGSTNRIDLSSILLYLPNLPTSNAGLTTGAVYRDGAGADAAIRIK